MRSGSFGGPLAMYSEPNSPSVSLLERVRHLKNGQLVERCEPSGLCPYPSHGSRQLSDVQERAFGFSTSICLGRKQVDSYFTWNLK